MLRRNALGLSRSISTMSITPVEDAIRLKARTYPHTTPHPVPSLINSDTDHRSLASYYTRDSQRLQHARSPPSHERQRVQRIAFSRVNHLGGLQVEDAAREAPDGVRFAERRDGTSWRDTRPSIADEDTGRGGEAGCKRKGR